MKISIHWIREFCPFATGESAAEIGVRFSLATAEVEEAEEFGRALRGLVAVRVLEARPHPGAENLRIARIQVGPEAKAGPREVVCGAPNVRAGLIAAYAAPGVTVGEIEVGVARIRGVESPGMLLSEAEAGVSDAADLLWELPAATPPGTPLLEVFPRVLDAVLTVDNKSLTHRPDLWGHYGIAREFSVIYGTPLGPYPIREELAKAPGSAGIRVEIDPEPAAGLAPRCPRYCGLRIEGVKVEPSPDWLRRRLYSVGVRPVSNIVDVTNLVMLELGQPLHSFDAGRVRGGLIRVRRAAAGETMRLLDGSEAKLGVEDLVIADAAGPVALAGVMGGEGSGISADTRSVFLEAASFNAAAVRRTSLRTVRTDSSARFEKSLDPTWPRLAILRAAGMILELCPGAKVVGPLQDVGFAPPPPIVIEVSPGAIADRLGTPVAPSRSHAILTGLGFQVSGGTGKSRDERWKVTVPSWRATKDISIPEDLIEEVGRLHGYGQIQPFAPLWPVAAPEPNVRRRLDRRAKDFLSLHGGLAEVFTYSMVGAAHCRTFGLDPDACLKLRNPMSEDLDRMRREIVPILLEKTRENQRFERRFGLYELGRVYLKDPARMKDRELPRENVRIAGVLSFESKDEANFRELRHLVLALAFHLGAEEPAVAPLAADRSWIHPVVGAKVISRGTEIGAFYRIHPGIEGRLELAGDVLAFDLDFDAIAGLERREDRYQKLPRFPFVTFDVAVVAPERTPAAGIEEAIRRGAGGALRRLEAFDVYRGKGLPEGAKSIAFHIAVGEEDHTLSGAEADRLRASVIAAVEGAGFKLRT